MKYKVGDKVRIRSLEVLKNHPKANSEGLMNKYCGNIAEVVDIAREGVYKLDIDRKDFCGSGWFWSEDMLEDVAYGECSSPSVEDFRIFPAFYDFSTINKLAANLDVNVTHKEEHPINLIGEHKFLTLKVKS